MNHHTQDLSCPLCEEKLSQAHPDLRAWFKKQVKPTYPQAHVAWGFRNQVEQEECFSNGKTTQHWPHSPHNHLLAGEPCSLALDLFELINGKGVWNPKFFMELNQEAQALKLPIKWGGQFRSLGDYDHFQLIFPF